MIIEIDIIKREFNEEKSTTVLRILKKPRILVRQWVPLKVVAGILGTTYAQLWDSCNKGQEGPFMALQFKEDVWDVERKEDIFDRVLIYPKEVMDIVGKLWKRVLRREMRMLKRLK